jgi:synaptojanin
LTNEIGEVTLVRFVGETMWVTFRDGQSALTAANKRSVRICDTDLTFQLKTENWLKKVEEEILLCTTNTINLCEDVNLQPDYNSLGIPETPLRPKSPPARPGPPSRPPLPKSPAASPKHHPMTPKVCYLNFLSH